MSSSTTDWEAALVRFLNELSQIQSDLLELLTAKQAVLRAGKPAELATMIPREQEILERLQACHDQRAALLAQASEAGLPSVSLRSLTTALPREQRLKLSPQIDAAESRSRILRHHSLTNWVVVQRNLLHLSRMIEIIATGGRLQPTYGKGGSAPAGGTMLDQAA